MYLCTYAYRHLQDLEKLDEDMALNRKILNVQDYVILLQNLRDVSKEIIQLEHIQEPIFWPKDWANEHEI